MWVLLNLVPKPKLTTSSHAQLKKQQFIYFNMGGVGGWMFCVLDVLGIILGVV